MKRELMGSHSLEKNYSLEEVSFCTQQSYCIRKCLSILGPAPLNFPIVLPNSKTRNVKK